MAGAPLVAVPWDAAFWPAHPTPSSVPTPSKMQPRVFMGMHCLRRADRRARPTSGLRWPPRDPSCTFTAGHAAEEAFHHHLHHPGAERAAEAPEREDEGSGGGV